MTEQTLSRRRLLVVGSSVLLAGCGGQSSDDNRFAQQTPGSGTATPANQQDAPSTETEARTDTPVETTTETETETETETPTETEEEEPTGEDALVAAEEALIAAVSEYHDPVFGNSIVEVDAATETFTPALVRNQLERAEDHLVRAADSITVEYSSVVELRAYVDFLDRLVAAQRAVSDVYGDIDSAMVALSEEDFSGADGPITFLDRTVENARTVVETLESETDSEAVTAIGPVTTDEYEAKIEQLHAELDGFGELESELQSMSDGLHEFQQGADKYIYDLWETASQRFYRSNRAFQSVSDALYERDTTGGVTGIVSDLETIASTMIDGTDELIESCEAGLNQNGGRRNQRLDTAKSTLSSPPFVDGLPSVQELRSRTQSPDDDDDDDDDDNNDRPLT